MIQGAGELAAAELVAGLAVEAAAFDEELWAVEVLGDLVAVWALAAAVIAARAKKRIKRFMVVKSPSGSNTAVYQAGPPCQERTAAQFPVRQQSISETWATAPG